MLAATGIAGAVVAALLVAINPAGAGTTTVTPTEPGTPPVVRDSSVTIKSDVGALFYYRTASNATNAANTAFAAQTPSGLGVINAFGRACVGNNTAPGGRNNSPRETITVKAPGGAVIHTEASKARDYSLGGIIAGGPVLSPQPAPGNANYLGDFPASVNGPRGMSFNLDMTGRPAGIYTVETVTQNMIKTDTTFVQGTCQIGYPNPANNKLAVLGVQTQTQTFEYRPWQHQFVDVFGGGKVQLNVVPAEGKWTVNGVSSQIWSGPTYKQRAYTLPGGADFMLPSDPVACLENPSSCLPSTAVECDPEAGCAPRLLTVLKPGFGEEYIAGIFDLKTKAFIASAGIGRDRRVLVSLGTDADALYHDLLAQLAAAAAAQGIDLMSLLATKVRLRLGAEQEISLSVLNGLQFNENLADKGGVQLVTDTTIQAGVILHIYLGTTSAPCVSGSASSADGVGYTSSSGAGYTVKRSSLLPQIPVVGPLGAIAGGPIWSIKGVFPASGTLVNTASAVLGIDTAADEPNGYPIWVNPFLSGIGVSAPKKMDFIGTATWSASETSLGGAGCFLTDLMLGTGVALYNSPINISLQDLPVLWDNNPGAAGLVAQIDAAIAEVVGSATSNPTVDGVLGQILALLPI